MRRVNVIWPVELEAEYLRLCDAFYDTITDEEAENDEVCYAKKGEYIKAHASEALNDWIAYVNRIRNESA